jgi:hypothetical protein
MNDEGALARRPRPDQLSRRSEGSNAPRRSAVAELDERLELRERLVAVLDELDHGDHTIAAANLEALLADLDEARAS